MKKHFFICAVALALFVPAAYAMEQEYPINPDVFTKEGKDYMGYALDLWVEAAQEGKVTTGLAEIFSFVKKSGIDNLIHDPVALEKANLGLAEIVVDPVFKTLSVLQMIGDYDYDGAKQLRADVSRVITQAVASKVLVESCPDFKLPKEDLIGFFACYGPTSVPWNIKFLKLNEHLDFASNAPYVEALVLIMGYLAQTGAGR